MEVRPVPYTEPPPRFLQLKAARSPCGDVDLWDRRFYLCKRVYVFSSCSQQELPAPSFIAQLHHLKGAPCLSPIEMILFKTHSKLSHGSWAYLTQHLLGAPSHLTYCGQGTTHSTRDTELHFRGLEDVSLRCFRYQFRLAFG